MVKKFKAGHYLPMLITSWGIVSTFLGFTKSYGGLIAARFFLGLCEGGLLGGMIVYLAMFYRRHEMLYRIGLFYCAAPLSGAFGGLLATGLAKIKYGGYDKWPWIFFIEGIVTVLFGVTAFFFMPHTPADAKFLTEEERAVALHRMKADAHGATSEEDVNLERFDWHWVRFCYTEHEILMLMLCRSAWHYSMQIHGFAAWRGSSCLSHCTVSASSFLPLSRLLDTPPRLHNYSQSLQILVS